MKRIHLTTSVFAVLCTLGSLAGVTQGAFGQTTPGGFGVLTKHQDSDRWRKLEINLEGAAGKPVNAGTAKLVLETPDVPLLSSMTSAPTGKWSVYEGKIEETGFTYLISVLDTYRPDQYDPTRFRALLVANGMLENWKSSKTHRFMTGGPLAIPFRNMESAVVSADTVNSEGTKSTSVYCVLKAHGRRIDISITYDPRREVNMKATQRLLDSVRVYPDVPDDTTWKIYQVQGLTLKLGEAPQLLKGKTGETPNFVRKGERVHEIYTVNLAEIPSQTPMGSITYIALPVGSDRKLKAEQIWKDDMFQDLKSGATNGKVDVQLFTPDTFTKDKKRLKDIVVATAMYTKKDSDTVISDAWAVVADGSRYWVVQFNLIPHWRRDEASVDMLLHQINLTLRSLDLNN